MVGGLVKNLRALAHYPYSGHGALLGNNSIAWQSVDEPLSYFAPQASAARQRYLDFVIEGLPLIHTTDKLGGGLLEALAKSGFRMRRGEDKPLYDARVLGEEEFVQTVWKQADQREAVGRKLKRQGWELRRLATEVAREWSVSVDVLFEQGGNVRFRRPSRS